MSSQPDAIINFLWLERLRDSPNAVPTLAVLAVTLLTVFIYQVSNVFTIQNSSQWYFPTPGNDTIYCIARSKLTGAGDVCH